MFNAWLYFSLVRTAFFRQESSKSFSWQRRHRMSLCDKFYLNWKLISFKISYDDMKGFFFIEGTIFVCSLDTWFSFFCFLWHYYVCVWDKWSGYKLFFGSNSKFQFKSAFPIIPQVNDNGLLLWQAIISKSHFFQKLL